MHPVVIMRCLFFFLLCIIRIQIILFDCFRSIWIGILFISSVYIYWVNAEEVWLTNLCLLRIISFRVHPTPSWYFHFAKIELVLLAHLFVGTYTLNVSKISLEVLKLFACFDFLILKVEKNIYIQPLFIEQMLQRI